MQEKKTWITFNEKKEDKKTKKMHYQYCKKNKDICMQEFLKGGALSIDTLIQERALTASVKTKIYFTTVVRCGDPWI